MRTFTYLIALLLVVPVTLLAVFFRAVSEATEHTLGSLVVFVFSNLERLVVGGMVVIPLAVLGVVTLGVLGFFAATRPYGLAVIATLGLICTVYVVRASATPIEGGEWLFLTPGILAALAAIAQIWWELRRGPVA